MFRWRFTFKKMFRWRLIAHEQVTIDSKRITSYNKMNFVDFFPIWRSEKHTLLHLVLFCFSL